MPIQVEQILAFYGAFLSMCSVFLRSVILRMPTQVGNSNSLVLFECLFRWGKYKFYGASLVRYSTYSAARVPAKVPCPTVLAFHAPAP